MNILKTSLLSFAALCAAGFLSGPCAFAEEGKRDAQKETAAQEAPKTAEKKETALSKWIEAENKLIGTLDKKSKDIFFVIRNKHGVIRSVRIVDRDIKNAIKACGKKNPDMKQGMADRFKAWEAAVLPVLDLAEKYLAEEIKTQKVVFESDFKHVLKLNDEAFAEGEKQIQKVPVTTKEACTSLLESMDRTEDEMVEILQDMLLPESVIRERVERAEKAAREEAEKEKAKKEKAQQ
ncbi:MAG: hypothetical protein H6853_00930 [Rhodospirillales bacterium]|nr:hypothetical protein [Alphaproteobacteria bacterium]USO03878.1 MAG: hypothetical protein H6853_00930 [Rhodospirillales bacterium]